jgi:hypothetical protein
MNNSGMECTFRKKSDYQRIDANPIINILRQILERLESFFSYQFIFLSFLEDTPGDNYL